MDVIQKIGAQQVGKENTDAWMVGEQLKDIVRDNPKAQEMVMQDLDNAEMSIEKCAAKIKEYADKHKEKGKNCFCVPPDVAEGIIREFYGITKESGGGRIDLADFFG